MKQQGFEMRGFSAVLVIAISLTCLPAAVAWADSDEASTTPVKVEESRPDARQGARDGKQNAREDGRAGRQDARGEGGDARRDAREEARDGKQDGREGGRDRRHDAR